MLAAEPEVSGGEEQAHPGMEEQDGHLQAAEGLPDLQLSFLQTEGKDPEREGKGGDHLSQMFCKVLQAKLREDNQRTQHQEQALSRACFFTSEMMCDG